MELEFVPPSKKNEKKVVVVSSEVAPASRFKRWENALVGYVLGEDPPFYSMNNFIKKWTVCGNVKLYSFDTGVFVFDFETAEYKQLILDQCPLMFNKNPLVLRPWKPHVSLDKKELKSVTTWIRLPFLKLRFWSPQILSKIGSLVGTPLCTDKLTAAGQTLAYARIFVEIHANQGQPHSVLIEDEKGHHYCQKVVYEWLPTKCTWCHKFGHSAKCCPSLLRC